MFSSQSTQKSVQVSGQVSKRTLLSAGLGLTAAAVLAFATLAPADHAAASAGPGSPAPDFSAIDSNGDTVKLSDFTGKKVILEWTNHDCPYVKKHYDAERKNMQSLQTAMTGEDIVWLTVVSSAPGKQGHVSGDEANALTASREAHPSHVLLDESGDIGRLFDAKTTPHMFVIDEQQQVQYAGAIDNIRSTDPGDIDTATNYVVEAVGDLDAGKPVAKAETAPYGCSIKY